MKKMNSKQIAYSKDKVAFAGWMRKHKFLNFVFSIFTVLIAVIAVTEGIQLLDMLFAGAAGGGTLLMSMGAIGNIPDDSDPNSVGRQIAYDIRLIETSQIDTSVAFPQPNASREVGDITLLGGETNHEFISHNRPKFLSTSELGDLTIDPTKDFDIAMANSFRDKILDFVEQKAGGKFIILFRKIETTQWYLLGSYDNPMRFMSHEVKGDDEAAAVTCKFQNKSIRQFYKYTGAISQAAATVLAADVTVLAYDGNDRYQLTDGTVAPVALATVSGIATANQGKYLTIYGSGGTYPTTIPDGAVFTMHEGVTWTGNSGSRITFQIYENNQLIEVLGSRIQTA